MLMLALSGTRIILLASKKQLAHADSHKTEAVPDTIQ